MNESAAGTLARRALAWIVIAAVVLLALKIVIGIVTGLVVTLAWAVLLVALVMGVLWALRHF